MNIRNGFVRSAGFVTLGNVAAQVINLLVLPVVSRLYGKGVFGEMAIWVAIASVVCVVVALGLNSAIMLPKEERDAKRLFTVNFVLMAVLSAAIYGVMAIWVRGSACLFMLLYTIGAVWVNMLTVFQNRRGNDRALFNNYWAGAAVNAGTVALAGWLTEGSLTGMMAAAVVTLAARGLMLMAHGSPFVRIGWGDVKGMVMEYREFVTWQLGANVLSKYTMKWQLSVIGDLFGTAMAGTFAMCDKIMGAPLRMIAGPIGDIYFRELSKGEREGERREGMTWRFVMWVMAASVPVVALIALWGDDVAAWFLGEEWREAGVWAMWLSTAYVFGFCGNALTYCRVAKRRQRLDFWMEVAKLSAVVASVVVAFMGCGDAVSVVMGLGIGLTIYHAADVAVDVLLTEGVKRMVWFIVLGIVYVVGFYGLNYIFIE